VHTNLQELQTVNPVCHRAVVVAALQRHSALGLHMLYVDCERDVRNVVLRRLGAQVAGDDVVQETFLRASMHIEQLRNVHKLEAWVRAIAKNESYKYLRQHQRLFVGGGSFHTYSTEVNSRKSELCFAMTTSRKGLSNRDQQFLHLHLDQELNREELSERLDISMSNVYKLGQRIEVRLAQSCAALALATSHQFACEVLFQLIRDSKGEYSPLIRKRITHHANECTTCGGAIKKTPASRLGSF
jgi:RNA polymerase sigma factor (sigma-70 family)